MSSLQPFLICVTFSDTPPLLFTPGAKRPRRRPWCSSAAVARSRPRTGRTRTPLRSTATLASRRPSASSLQIVRALSAELGVAEPG